jgi:Arc/MetJ-type ribon-helix-helix transcriptional regulator
MTKVRISATIDEKTEKILDSMLKDGSFRNKSHVIEKAIELLKEVKDDKDKR